MRVVFFNLKIFIVLLCTGLFSGISYADQKVPKGEIIPEQTFKANFKNYKNITFASYNDYETGPAKVHFYLIKDNQVVLEFSDFYINSTSWSFESVKAVSFRDVNADGLKDVVVIAEYVTGIGPTSMIPFLIKGVYFQGKNEFSSNLSVNKLLNSEKNYSKLKNISSIVRFVRNIYAEK
ncbi:MAG: hypothetical protein KAU21_14785 [Gammaproteobacteria bacterium]|nr:hypothetical protein [Gammaproteobacteria bacterium]